MQNSYQSRRDDFLSLNQWIRKTAVLFGKQICSKLYIAAKEIKQSGAPVTKPLDARKERVEVVRFGALRYIAGKKNPVLVTRGDKP